MSATKRNRGPADSDDDETCAKMVKTSHGRDSPAAGKLPAQQHSDEVKITFEIRPTNTMAQDDERKKDSPDSSDSDTSVSLYDPEQPRWMEQINGFANVGQDRVAECNAKLIRRESIRRAFWANMGGLYYEPSALAFELFDRYGRLDREFYEHEIRKGSGVWSRELDHGDILLFDYISVKSLWRRQGVETKLVNAIFDKARPKSKRFFAFVSPMYLAQDFVCGDEKLCDDEKLYAETVRQQSTIFQHFFRSLGFRRVGISGWLAFADNDSHPSRLLDEAHDWDAPEESKEEQPTPEIMRTIVGSLSDPSTPEAECVIQMEKVFASEENAPLWAYTYGNGNTILHEAAMNGKAGPISYIMSKNPHLAGKRNTDGYTPLEMLQSSMELQRTRRQFPGTGGIIVMSDKFRGFCQSDIACLAALTGTEIFDLSTLSDRDIWAVSSATDEMASKVREANPIRNTLRLKYGCTCGQCIGGFLSPRMRIALLYEAETQHDILQEFPYPDSSGTDWVTGNDDVLGYLTTPVRENLKTNKSMIQGFINMCNHIARCLKQKRLPNTATVLDFYRERVSEWPPVTRNYLQRGGTVAAVAMMLFDRAMYADKWAGDPTFDTQVCEDLVNHPICRNDHEFGFVRRMCGYESIFA